MSSDMCPPDASLLSSEQVENFLRVNPDFLKNRPELMVSLLPDRDFGAGVADFQAKALHALRREADDLRAGARDVIHMARENLSVQAATHQAVVALLAAQSLDELFTILAQDIPVLVQVDMAIILSEPSVSLPYMQRVTRVPCGMIEQLVEHDDVRLRTLPDLDPAIYREASTLICSDALVRLKSQDHPPALLALASRDPATFEPGQGTELLVFLAAVLDFCLSRWLSV